MKLLLALFSISLTLAACNNDVPHVDDPHKIEINGKSLSQKEFLEKYCDKSSINENCVAVSRAMIKDSTRGKIPTNW